MTNPHRKRNVTQCHRFGRVI